MRRSPLSDDMSDKKESESENEGEGDGELGRAKVKERMKNIVLSILS